MARYIGPVCRLCRREDMKLFLKGDRCYTDKCGYERRAYPPGQHGQGRRRKASDYGEQLREKQKVKRIYRLGFTGDHAEARQLVRHGHFTVNGRRVNIPSYLVRTGDVVAVGEKSRKIKRIEESLGAIDRRGVPQWIELEKEK